MPVDFSKTGRNVFDTEEGYYVIIENTGSGYYACTSETEEPSGEQPHYIEKLIIIDNEGYREYVQNKVLPAGDNLDTAKDDICRTAVVKDNGKEYTLSLLTPSLEYSVFGRMCFLDGEGLTRYKAEPEFSNEVLVYRRAIGTN